MKTTKLLFLLLVLFSFANAVVYPLDTANLTWVNGVAYQKMEKNGITIWLGFDDLTSEEYLYARVLLKNNTGRTINIDSDCMQGYSISEYSNFANSIKVISPEEFITKIRKQANALAILGGISIGLQGASGIINGSNTSTSIMAMNSTASMVGTSVDRLIVNGYSRADGLLYKTSLANNEQICGTVILDNAPESGQLNIRFLIGNIAFYSRNFASKWETADVNTDELESEFAKLPQSVLTDTTEFQKVWK